MYNLSTQRSRIVLAFGALLLVSCGGAPSDPVQDLTGHESLKLFKLQAMAGTRDGDRLRTHAIFSDSSSILTVEMHFQIGSPTRLESGTWRWMRNGQLLAGAVAARSVTFLGGQDGPPSIGGTFDLLGPDAVARYRVRIPVSQLKTRFQAR